MTPETLTEPLLTVRECADALRQSSATVYRKVADGSLPALRLGAHGPLRIRVSALEDHLRPRLAGESVGAARRPSRLVPARGRVGPPDAPGDDHKPSSESEER